jgi:hypothetical protein
MIRDAQYWIDRLSLKPHPEGGYYKEIYRSEEIIKQQYLPERYTADHCFSTAIYFLVKGHEHSSFHRIKSDELWHFYCGSSLILYSIDKDGMLFRIKLGSNLEQGQLFQAHIKRGCWFAAEPENADSYTLVGCTVSPGFEFEDFELGNKEELSKLFPRHQALIHKLAK